MRLAVAGRVATLTLDRPPVNAISDAWVAAFHARLDDLARRDDWQVLHIRSACKVFCAGADLAEVKARSEANDGGAATAAATKAFQVLFARIEALPQVSLAEIGGTALGGGFELALACDLRIAAEEAKLGLPETRLGLLPGAGGTQRLTRLAGPAIAARIILSADVVDGKTAERLGLVQWAVPGTCLAEEAAAIAARTAGLHPGALAACKACISDAQFATQLGYDREVAATRNLAQTDETKERVRAFLAGRR
ncbi:MAG: enoyl-CoA hydratase/isomerase family protein [Alphaproteobacteria bacterium]|nr:enoyl-CoA hydratase/isomerase family protein [Alphaproteobacteria bacterium]